MATMARSWLWPVLPTLTAITLACPTSARAERIDIDDVSALGPVLMSIDLGRGDPLERLISEVRYIAGIYSYVYAIQGSPNFPAFLRCCDDGRLASFAVGGHPLENTWGAILGSDEPWRPNPGEPPGTTHPVASITPLHDGFLVVPDGQTQQYTVMYMQSRNPPSTNGTLTYTGFGCLAERFDPVVGGYVCVERGYDSFQVDGALVPTPEPGTIVLFGLGLVALVAKRRARGDLMNGEHGVNRR